MNKPILIYPSLLAADFGHLADACRACAASGADGLHLDIMDGNFVPNISMGPEAVRMAGLVDQNGDGSILDDVAGFLMKGLSGGGSKGAGGLLGGLLGGLFGGKK